MLFRGCTVIYIYNSINIIQIQDKLIRNYKSKYKFIVFVFKINSNSIQTQCKTNIISKFKIFLNSQD